jgi:hypothetical protein
MKWFQPTCCGKCAAAAVFAQIVRNRIIAIPMIAQGYMGRAK